MVDLYEYIQFGACATQILAGFIYLKNEFILRGVKFTIRIGLLGIHVSVGRPEGCSGIRSWQFKTTALHN